MIRLAAAFSVLLVPAAFANESAHWQTDQKVLRCSPAVVPLGEPIRLQLGMNHGRELSVAREHDKTTFLLVVVDAPQGYTASMEPSLFASARSVDISTTLEATPWEPPFNQSKVRVFDRAGNYWFFVSENLESEAGGYRCKVKVVGGRK